MLIYELTVQVRVADFAVGRQWYQTLLARQPDFVPHEGFVEWEIIPGMWLQVAEGEPAPGSGPLRLGLTDLESERERLIRDLAIPPFEIYSRPEVPVRWATFQDPWHNRIGLFEHLDASEKVARIHAVLGRPGAPDGGPRT